MIIKLCVNTEIIEDPKQMLVRTNAIFWEFTNTNFKGIIDWVWKHLVFPKHSSEVDIHLHTYTAKLFSKIFGSVEIYFILSVMIVWYLYKFIH